MQKLQEQVADPSVTVTGPEDDWYSDWVRSTPFATYDSDLSFMMKNYLEEDSIYFDVGANIGATVIPISKYLKYGSAYAFEPSCAYKYLEQNIENNSLTNVKGFNIALGEQQGEVNFKTNDCLAQSYCITDIRYLKEENFDRVKVEKLDDIVQKENIKKVDFIKIDVEGYESNVLKGCDDIIEKYNPIFYVEFNSWCLLAFKNEHPRKFLEYLYEKFTNLYWIRNCILTPLDSESKLIELLRMNITYNGCVDNLICLNGEIETRKKSKLFFNVHELQTEVGIKRGDLLCCNEGQCGTLSYGPYIPLLKGKYKVGINICVSSANQKDEVGHWDVYTPTFDKQMVSGRISAVNCPFIEAEFEVTDQLDNASFGIRTFSNGQAILELKLIVIERIGN